MTYRLKILLFTLLFFCGIKEISAQITADFTATQTNPCEGFAVGFLPTINSTNTIATVQWDRGDGVLVPATAPAYNTSEVYTTAGLYTIQLIVTDVMGNVETVTKVDYIDVVENPDVDFSFTPAAGCQNHDVQFNFVTTSTVTNGWTWRWIFTSNNVCFGSAGSDTIVRTNGNPFIHTFTQDGTYDVKLIVENQLGCQAEITKFSIIDVFPAPTADFTYQIQADCDTTTDVAFTSISTIPCTPTPIYNWDFGDGNSSNTTNSNIVHEYLTSGTYTVRLIVNDGNTNNCSDTTFQTLTINAQPTLTATASTLTACQDEVIQFTGTTTGNVTGWLWDFGNGTTSTQQNPTYAFPGIGCFNVTLSVTIDTCGLTTTLDTCLQVNPTPSANFSSLDAFEVCDAPHTMSFTSAVLGTLFPVYDWNFGDGTTSNLQNPTKTWNYSGLYETSLTVSTPSGCTFTTQIDTVLVDSILVNFGSDITSGCDPLTVNFTDSSTGLSNITGWLWDFGDGNTSTQQNPTHTYNTTGDFDVTLTVTNATNCTETLTINNYISIGVPPIFDVAVSNNTPCEDETISFINNNTNPAVTNWAWFNGIETVSGFTPPDTSFENGTYDIWVTGTLNGCTDTLFLNNFITVPQVNANFNNDGDCDVDPNLITFNNTSDGNIVNYSWNFGTGNAADTSNLEDPVFNFPGAGVYTVTLAVTDINGCTDVLVDSVNLLLPVAVFGWTTDSVDCVAAEFPVTLTDTSLNYQNCNWDIANANYLFGTDSTSCPPIINFDSSGTYNIQLVVIADNGCTDTTSKEICVTDVEVVGVVDTTGGDGNSVSGMIDFVNNSGSGGAGGGGGGTGAGCVIQIDPVTGDTTYINQIGEVAINCNDNFNLYSGCAPLTVAFSDSSTSFPDSIDTWIWDFGDGTTSTDQNPTHIYNDVSGEFVYMVTLTVFNTFGVTRTDTIPTFIQVTQPIADFSLTRDTACSNQLVQGIDSSAGVALNYEWNIDGVIDNNQNPVFSFPSEGTYPICLTVTDRNGCDSTICDSIVIIDPVANFAADTLYSDCANLSVQFSDSSINAVSYLWQFGNDSTSTLQNPSIVYSGTGFYDVSLIATSTSGCQDTMTLNNFIRIDGPLVTSLSVSPEDSCVQHTVGFNIQGDNIGIVTIDFGNGQDTTFGTLTSQLLDTTIYYTYLTDSIYNPILRVQDSLNCERIFDFNEVRTTDPKAVFTIDTTAGCIPLNISANAAGSEYTNQYTWIAPDATIFGQGTATPVIQYPNQGFYNEISLVITDINNCTDTLSFTDTITAAGVNIGFDADNYTGCFPLTVNFTDTSTAFPDTITTWLWQFSNPDISNLQNPTYVYDDFVNVNRRARLTITNSFGCTASIQKNILPTFPTAAFTTDTFYCTGQDVDYTNQSTGLGLTYLWDFGDGNTSTATNPSHFYASEDTFQVVLTVTDQNGCIDRDTLERIIVANPIAAFGSDEQYLACPPDSVQFLDSSINAVAWRWEIEGTNPTNYNIQNPSVGYLNPGIFDVQLIVTSQSGCQDTITRDSFIEVAGPFGVLNFAPDEGCVDLQVDFTIPLFNTVNIFIDKGDGTPADFFLNPADTFLYTHIYTERGTYTPTIFIQDSVGCQRVLTDGPITVTDPEPIFTVSQDTFCLPNSITTTNNSLDIASYEWFNSGGIISSNTAFTPNFSFNNSDTAFHEIGLIITDVYGCKDTLVQTVLGTNVFPNAVSSTTDGCRPMTVQFTDQTAVFPDSVQTWLWDFGDAQGNSVLQNPTYIYQDIGVYTPTLTVTNYLGCSETFTLPNIETTFPSVSYTPTLTFACTGQDIFFNNNSTGQALTYLWDFNNGQTFTSEDVTYAFPVEGNYNVCLTTTDINGCDSTFCQIITIANPVANFTVDTIFRPCPPATFQFTDLSANAVSWAWSFGDGNTSTLQNPSNTYTETGSYDVQLIVTNASGCMDTLFRPTYIEVGGPVGNFTFTPNQGCADVTATFTGNVTANTVDLYIWNFGDGNSETSISNANTDIITHTYTTTGTFFPTLTLQDFTGCQFVATLDSIEVDTLQFDFFANDTLLCETGELTFTPFIASSSPIDSVRWNFGGANITTSDLMMPTIPYNTVGDFDVELTVYSRHCTKTITKANYIKIAPIPNTDFTIIPNEGCNPTTAIFTDATTIFSGNVTSWAWAFGDGNTASTQNTANSYQTIGDFDVELITISNHGCADTLLLIDTVSIYPIPNPMFDLDTFACTLQDVNFTNNSTGNNLTYSWDFGDGNISTLENPVHQYTTVGVYTVCLTTLSSDGCDSTICKNVTIANPSAGFTSNTQYLPCPNDSISFTSQSVNDVAWRWDFGDGNTSTLQNPTHTYTATGFYDVQLIVVGLSGCEDTLLIPNYIEIGGPVGNFTFTPNQGCADVTATFTGNVTANTIDLYIWNYGDGTIDTTFSNAVTDNVTHTYTTTGTYFPTMTIEDFTGCQFTATLDSIEVDTLQFDFFANDTLFCEIGNLNFTPFIASSSPIDSVLWTFEGAINTTSTAMIPTVAYDTIGDFDVTLTVYSRHCTKTITKTDYIKAAGIPNVDFATAPPVGCNPTTVFFTDNTTITNGNLVTWNWDFGNGNGSTLQNPTHSYQTVGVYDVQLITTSNHACTDSITYANVITINPIPEPSFGLDTFACTLQDVNFTNTSTGNGLTYGWDFGDGNTSTAFEPTHQYASEGTFTVCLTVTDVNGCDSTFCQNLLIGNPAAAFSANTQYLGCPPDSVQFTDLSAFATEWKWSFGDGDTSILQNPIHTYTTTGFYDVQLIITSASGCQDTLLQTNYIEVGGPVGSFAFTPKQGCADVTATFVGTLTNNSVTQYHWTFGNGDSITHNLTAGIDSFEYIYTTAGTYFPTLTFEDSTGCRFTTTLDSIEVDTLQFDFFANDTLFCETESLTFTPFITSSSPIDSVLWNFNGAIIPTSDLMMPTIAYDTIGDFDVSLTVYSRHCTKTITKTQYIKAAPIPESYFTTLTNPFCSEQTIEFLDAHSIFSGNVVSWDWDFGDGDTSILVNPTHIYADSGFYDINLSLVSDFGCTDDTTITVYINKTPEPVMTPAPVLCIGEVFTLTASGGDSYAWYNGLNLVCDTCTSIDVAPIVTTDYTLIATSNAGCSDTITQTVSVLPFAIPPLVVSNDTTICKGDVVQLFASGGYDITQYVWDNSIPGLSCYVHCSNPFASPDVTTTYYVTLTWDGGCSKTDSITITVIDDAQPILGVDRIICQGESVQLGTTAGMNAIWSPGDGLSCVFCDNPIASPNVTTEYTVIATTTNGCELRDTIIINVQTQDMVNAGDDATICLGTSIPFDGIGTGTPIWTPAATLTDSSILNPVATPIITTDYVLTITNDLCVQSDTVTITVADKVDISIADIEICEGEAVEIDVNGFAETLTFTPDDGIITIQPTIIQPEQTTTYTVIGEIPLCESDTTSFTIQVNPIPDIGLLPAMSVFPNTTIALPIDNPNAAYQHIWTPSTQLNCSDCFNPFFIADSTFDELTIYVDLLTDDGCTFTDSILITLAQGCDKLVALPTAFTPNDDGQNDIFRVRPIGVSDIETFQVFNRWGEKLFETSLLSEGWDGTKNGVKVPQGTYVYYVQAVCPLTGETELIKGDVFVHY